MTLRADNRFETGAELCSKLAEVIATDLRTAIAARGQATLAVSGGRTPIPLFQALAQQDLAWDKVVVTLVDDRWVDADHKDSNEALVRTNLLVGRAMTARFISLKADTATPEESLAVLEGRLADLPVPLDVVVLGMGDDGHTASWFPRAPQLASAITPSAGQKLAWTDPVTAPHLRITLTLPVVEAARHVILHIAGAGKLPVLAEAQKQAPLDQMPIRYVLHSEKVALDVYWSN